MTKMGRPKKLKADRKTEFIKVLLTPAEKETMVTAANGADLSAWARLILLAAAAK
jgi:hypothetical protein